MLQDADLQILTGVTLGYGGRKTEGAGGIGKVNILNPSRYFFLSVTSSNMLLAIIVSILIADLSIKRKTKTRLTLNIGNDKGPPYCVWINNLINAWLVEFNVALTVNHKSTDPKEF